MNSEPASPIVHLLWTGGWDSTFRLLHLLLVQRRRVQPYYLIDSERLSTGLELRTIKRIRTRLYARDSWLRALLAPTIFREVTDIAPRPTVTAAFDRLRATTRIGSQYDWIARYRDEQGITGLEMSLVRSESAVNGLLKPLVVPVALGGDRYFELGPQHAGSDAFEVFRGFRFPLFEVSKPEMGEMAKAYSFADLLELSWFCHAPRANGTACGLCAPCGGVIQGGLERRVPLSSRAKHRGRRYLRELRRLMSGLRPDAPSPR